MIFSKSWNKVIGPEAFTALHNWRDYDEGLLHPVVFSPSACLQLGAPEEETGISPHLLVFFRVKWISLLAEELFPSLTFYCKFIRLRKHPVGIAMGLRLCCGLYDCSVVEEYEKNEIASILKHLLLFALCFQTRGEIWKAALQGPGVSSPRTAGSFPDRMKFHRKIVTCWLKSFCVWK